MCIIDSESLHRVIWRKEISLWSKSYIGGKKIGREATAAIAAVKEEVQLQEWTAQIVAQQISGKTVQQWCAENGVNVKTYYYRLRRVHEQCVESEAAIVPITVPQQRLDIHIEKNGIPSFRLHRQTDWMRSSI